MLVKGGPGNKSRYMYMPWLRHVVVGNMLQSSNLAGVGLQKLHSWIYPWRNFSILQKDMLHPLNHAHICHICQLSSADSWLHIAIMNVIFQNIVYSIEIENGWLNWDMNWQFTHDITKTSKTKDADWTNINDTSDFHVVNWLLILHFRLMKLR